MGILSFHATNGNAMSTVQGISTAYAAAVRLQNSGIGINPHPFVAWPGPIANITVVWNNDASSGDLPSMARDEVAPAVVNLRGEYQGIIDAASTGAGNAYALGVSISIAEGQATVGDDARSIVFDSLGNALTPAGSLGLESAPLEQIRNALVQDDGMPDVYQQITFWRGRYQGELDSARSATAAPPPPPPPPPPPLPPPSSPRDQAVAANRSAIVDRASAGSHIPGLGNIAASVPTPQVQGNWLYCHTCKGFFFAGSGPGVCAGGGQHISGPHDEAHLAHGDSSLPGQHDFRYCKKCHILFFARLGPGVCPAGTSHDGSNSWDYALRPVSGRSVGFQPCTKCHALVLAQWQPAPIDLTGVCPAGGGHVAPASEGSGYMFE